MTNRPDEEKRNEDSFWARHKVNFWWAVFGVVFGAFFGHILDKPADYVRDRSWELWCKSHEHLNTGLRLRNEAVDLQLAAIHYGKTLSSDVSNQIEAKHREANAAFALAADCGSPLAKAHLGHAYCFGFGVPKDRRKGLALIRDAGGMTPHYKNGYLTLLFVLKSRI